MKIIPLTVDALQTFLHDSINKVKDFVNIIAVLDGSFDLVSGRYTIDAKSIMGIFSLDLGKPLRLDVHDDKIFDDLSKKLSEFTM